ncbi:hypothetical protein EDC54_101626 [Samsonia erythrinae]|uniref:Uncharacterized protein n=1 Tax=Samsonia erythrinae TaxID=160434 RepID=A0A4R3VUB8_9GAMM|nr:hypothetical protein EDC54_101626 [Samsonia erythrinae]
MRKIDYHGTTICVLDDSDMLTDCPVRSYAVIEDSGFYVAVRVGETDAPAIHIDPVPTLEDALDIIAGQFSFFEWRGKSENCRLTPSQKPIKFINECTNPNRKMSTVRVNSMNSNFFTFHIRHYLYQSSLQQVFFNHKRR